MDFEYDSGFGEDFGGLTNQFTRGGMRGGFGGGMGRGGFPGADMVRGRGFARGMGGLGWGGQGGPMGRGGFPFRDR